MNKFKVGHSMKLVAIIIFLSIGVTSCSFGYGTSIIKKDFEINAKLLDEIEEYDSMAIEYLRNRDIKKLESMFHSELIANLTDLEGLVEQIAPLLEDQELDYIKRFHSKLRKIGDYDFTIMSPAEDEIFVARIEGLSNEAFVTLRTTKSGIADTLVSMIYLKENGKWKIGSFHFSSYSFHGLTAQHFYEEAKRLIDKEQHLPAFYNMLLWNQVIDTGGNISYKNSNEMQVFMQDLYDDFVESAGFPLSYDDLEDLSVFDVSIKVFNEGIYPEVKYITKVNMDDARMMESEAHKLHEKMSSEFNGLNDAFDTIIYTAFNEYPYDPEKSYRAFGTHVDCIED